MHIGLVAQSAFFEGPDPLGPVGVYHAAGLYENAALAHDAIEICGQGAELLTQAQYVVVRYSGREQNPWPLSASPIRLSQVALGDAG